MSPKPDAKPDAELDALEACLRVLLPLDLAARSRIMSYLDDRLQREPEPEGDEAST